jgi:two-component system, OmpR family, aerobic respiration control sensor histidine kinase ArcB
MNNIDPSWETRGIPPRGSRELAMLAHDIRGALNGVIGGLGQIDDSELQPELRAQIDRVSAAALTLHCLVRSVVGDEVDPELEQAHSVVHVRRLLRHIARRWTGEAQEKGLDFALETSNDLPDLLEVPLVPLARIVGNLIGNAIKYAERGRIRLEVGGEDGGIVFRLRDDGPGLSEEVRRGLFGYGVRANGSAKPGHGLGLHIAKRLTDELGGTITIENRSEGGVEARLAFPAALCRRTVSAPADIGRGDAGAGRPDLSGLLILLAEDNPTNQMVAGQMLRSMSAEVVIASDGIEALEMFETTPCDLVLADIEMPRKSGLDVIRAIRARTDERAGTPVVALTAYALREHRARIAEVGADGLITKPITSVEAFGRTVLEHARAGRNRGIAGEAAAPAADEAGPVVDRAVYDGLFNAIGAEMMAELLEKVDADLAESARELARARDPLDLEVLRGTSHILISVAGAVGASRLQTSARRLNGHAHTGAAEPRIKSELDTCLGEIAAARRFVGERRAES